MSAPSLSVTFEPSEGGVVSYLKCAPSVSNGPENGYLNLFLWFTNTGSTTLRVTKVEVSVPNSPTAPKAWDVMVPPPDWPALTPGQMAPWAQPDDYTFALPAGPLSVKVRIWAAGTSDPALIFQSLVPHLSPTPDGSYHFWGAVRDLRPGEFWQVHGTSHSQAGPQLFAYDVGVSVESGSGHSYCLPGTDGTKNEHSRIWSKPIYAIADGTVVHFRNDFPDNPRPLQAGEEYKTTFPDLYKQWNALGDGNGNFFTIESGPETVIYAHMIAGTLNPALLSAGAAVKAGDFLGLAGNSGNSSGPHLHIHANETVAGANKSWDKAPRPMPMRGARAVTWSSLGADAATAPWVKLQGRGFPTADCAVWPSEVPVVNLRWASVRHFAIDGQGHLWTLNKENGRILTTNDRLPARGVLLDVNPNGSGKEIALIGQKLYVIGTDDRLWEGRPDGWYPMSGSPLLKRITADATTGKLWALRSAGGALVLNPATNVWTEAGGIAKDICAANGVPYLIGMDDKVYRGAGAEGFVPLPGEGRAKRIAIDPSTNTLWVVGMNDGIWSHAGGGNWCEHPGDGRARDITVFCGTPYIIGSDYGIWQSVGENGWYRLNLVEGV
jgi:hypothetical protein